MVIGGGTTLGGRGPGGPVEVVDLQGLGLDRISRLDAGAVRIGATATLQAIADDESVPSAVRDAARRELPSTLRTLATIAGCIVAADRESELLTALLAHKAVVHVRRSGRGDETTESLEELLGGLPLPPGTIITAVTAERGGKASTRRVGRTAADRAIVSVTARRSEGTLRLALSGCGTTPLVFDLDGGTAAEAVQATVDGLEPPGDFRGSPEYRRHLAGVLARRALEEVA